MPAFLWTYVAGMTAALCVGLILYAVIGTRMTPLLATILGPAAGQLWGRTFRMLLLLTAVLGGLSTQWYGCTYSDHQAVAKSPRLMAEKATDQVAQATRYATMLVVATAAVGAILFASLHPRRPHHPQ